MTSAGNHTRVHNTPASIRSSPAQSPLFGNSAAKQLDVSSPPLGSIPGDSRGLERTEHRVVSDEKSTRCARSHTQSLSYTASLGFDSLSIAIGLRGPHEVRSRCTPVLQIAPRACGSPATARSSRSGSRTNRAGYGPGCAPAYGFGLDATLRYGHQCQAATAGAVPTSANRLLKLSKESMRHLHNS